MDFKIEMAGLDELDSQLEALGLDIQSKAQREGLRAAAKPILADVKARISAIGAIDTGHMLRSTKLRVRTFKKKRRFGADGVDMQVEIGVFKNRKETPIRISSSGKVVKGVDAPTRAWWREHGTKAHSLGKGSRSANRKGESKGARHPGTTAKPFLRPALKSNAQTAVSTVKETIAQRIKRIARNRRG